MGGDLILIILLNFVPILYNDGDGRLHFLPQDTNQWY